MLGEATGPAPAILICYHLIVGSYDRSVYLRVARRHLVAAWGRATLAESSGSAGTSAGEIPDTCQYSFQLRELESAVGGRNWNRP